MDRLSIKRIPSLPATGGGDLLVKLVGEHPGLPRLSKALSAERAALADSWM